MEYVGAGQEKKKIYILTWKSGKWMGIKMSTTLQLIQYTNHLGQLSVLTKAGPSLGAGNS